MIARPAFFRPRRSTQSIDLTAFKLVETCHPMLDDPDTQPRGDWRLGALVILGSGALFWGAFGVWVAFLLKLW